MAETCIICLGNICTDDTATSASKQPALEADVSAGDNTSPLTHGGSELIATLLPCGHFLHDECLKPWVERANSCPICRAAFNMVELRLAIGGESSECNVNFTFSGADANSIGPVESSYAVQDKRQVADIDPTLVIEEDLVDERDRLALQPFSRSSRSGRSTSPGGQLHHRSSRSPGSSSHSWAQDASGELRVTDVWIRRDGRWQIVRRHATPEA